MIQNDKNGEEDQFIDPENNLAEEEDDEQEMPKGPLSRLPSKKHALPALLLFFIFFIVSSITVKYSLMEQLSLNGAAVYQRYEFWRLLTALAVHGDLLHLVSNGFLFILFGWMLHTYFGQLLFPVMSLSIGIATNLAVAWIYDPDISVIGSSGMTYGMVALWIVLYLKFDIDRSFPQRLLRSVGFVLVMLIPEAVDIRTSYLSHAVGFLIGFASGILLFPWVRVREPG